MSKRTQLPPGLTIPTGKRKGKTPEGQVLKGVLDMLTAYGVFAWRNNSGAMTNPAGRLVRFGKAGSGDTLGILPSGRFISVEVKAPGNKPTDLQRAFLASVNRAGAVGIWVDNLGRLESVLKVLMVNPDARFEIDGTHLEHR